MMIAGQRNFPIILDESYQLNDLWHYIRSCDPMAIIGPAVRLRGLTGEADPVEQPIDNRNWRWRRVPYGR